MTFGKLWGTWNWLEKGLFALTVTLTITGLGIVIWAIGILWGGNKVVKKWGGWTLTYDPEGSEDENGDENGDNGEDENGDDADPEGVHGGNGGGSQLPFDKSIVDLGVEIARQQAFGQSALQAQRNK